MANPADKDQRRECISGVASNILASAHRYQLKVSDTRLGARPTTGMAPPSSTAGLSKFKVPARSNAQTVIADRKQKMVEAKLQLLTLVLRFQRPCGCYQVIK